MIKLIFIIGTELMNFTIEDRNIYYKDKFWTKGIRCIPKDEDFINKIIMSRNKIPKRLVEMFTLSQKDKEEYDNAKTDEELAEIIIRDCKSKGLKLLDYQKI